MTTPTTHLHNTLQSIYDNSADICVTLDEMEIPLSVLHGIIHTAKPKTNDKNKEVKKAITSIHGLLDVLYNTCKTMCITTNSESVALPVLKMLIQLSQRKIQ